MEFRVTTNPQDTSNSTVSVSLLSKDTLTVLLLGSKDSDCTITIYKGSKDTLSILFLVSLLSHLNPLQSG